jgi:hypothetical protein
LNPRTSRQASSRWPIRRARHVKIDDVIESTELNAMFALVAEHDFGEIPREISIGTTDSLLSILRT